LGRDTGSTDQGRAAETARAAQAGDVQGRGEQTDSSGPGRGDRAGRSGDSGSGRVERRERVERPDGGRQGQDQRRGRGGARSMVALLFLAHLTVIA